MKKAFLIGVVALLTACNQPKSNELTNNFIVAESASSTLSFETEKVWECSDLSNADNKINNGPVYNAILKAIREGKMKAYRNFPNDEISVSDLEKRLVTWDSTAQIENPNKPGELISAPMRFEITANEIPLIKFNENISLDTLNYQFTKKINYVSVYFYKHTETGETVGIGKLFDAVANAK